MVANEPYVNENVDENPLTKGSDLSGYRLTSIQAVICVPLHKGGKFVAAMAVHQATPRAWSREEIELVREVVDRCWESLERLRAENDRALLLDSERAARQDFERANSVKDDFLATLSHELRTPLTAITGWVHIMRKKLGEHQQDLRKGVDVIERSTKAQVRLIDDLLDMSKIVSGKLQLELQVLDPASAVQAACEMVLVHAQGAGLTLKTQIQPVQAVLGDAGRLQQMVWNLLVNAVKFTHRGGTVTVGVSQTGAEILITVTDTGIGIPKDFAPHLFERFRQADGSITRKFGGLGLGLSIVQHLAEMHGGSISASSPGEGQGSTFTLRLPAHGDHVSGEPEQTGAIGLNVDLSRMTILVVDDDTESRILLKRILQDSGARVDVAADGYAAMSMVESKVPDLICSDIGMPGLDGYEFVQWLRQRSPEEGGHIPAIAMTAFARQQDRDRSMASGFNLHLAKPVDPDQLLAAVAKLLYTSSSR